MGFARLESEHSIYIYKRATVRIIIPVFIDNLTLASSDKQALDDFVVEFSKHVEMISVTWVKPLCF